MAWFLEKIMEFSQTEQDLVAMPFCHFKFLQGTLLKKCILNTVRLIYSKLFMNHNLKATQNLNITQLWIRWKIMEWIKSLHHLLTLQATRKTKPKRPSTLLWALAIDIIHLVKLLKMRRWKRSTKIITFCKETIQARRILEKLKKLEMMVCINRKSSNLKSF